jgi:hypothetical protein
LRIADECHPQEVIAEITREKDIQNVKVAEL